MQSFIIGGTEIKCEVSVKLLGVTIDYLMNFDTHNSNVCKKANRQINDLFRISHNLSLETKVLIYKSFISSNFNYCHLIWHFATKPVQISWKNYNLWH